MGVSNSLELAKTKLDELHQIIGECDDTIGAYEDLLTRLAQQCLVKLEKPVLEKLARRGSLDLHSDEWLEVERDGQRGLINQMEWAKGESEWVYWRESFERAVGFACQKAADDVKWTTSLDFELMMAVFAIGRKGWSLAEAKAWAIRELTDHIFDLVLDHDASILSDYGIGADGS